MVSRKVQKSLGLLTGVVVYGTAIGGLFGLVFAFASGRMEIRSSANALSGSCGFGVRCDRAGSDAQVSCESAFGGQP